MISPSEPGRAERVCREYLEAFDEQRKYPHDAIPQQRLLHARQQVMQLLGEAEGYELFIGPFVAGRFLIVREDDIRVRRLTRPDDVDALIEHYRQKRTA